MLVPVCPLASLPPGDAVRVEAPLAGDRAVAVFHTDEGLYAVDDSCTHQDTPLSDGYLEGCRVECPLHAAMFDLRTGRPDGPPASEPVRTHAVVMVDGVVHVEVAGGSSVVGGSSVADGMVTVQ